MIPADFFASDVASVDQLEKGSKLERWLKSPVEGRRCLASSGWRCCSPQFWHRKA